MIRNLAGENDGRDLAGDVEGIRLARQRPVPDPEGSRVDREYDVSSLDEEAAADSCRRNGDLLVSGKTQYREPTAVTPSRGGGKSLLRRQAEQERGPRRHCHCAPDHSPAHPCLRGFPPTRMRQWLPGRRDNFLCDNAAGRNRWWWQMDSNRLPADLPG